MSITIETIQKSVQGNRLLLWHQDLTDDDVHVICEYLNQHKEITILNVSHNQIGDAGAKALAAVTSLTFINIDHNKVGDAGAEAFAANTNLHVLDLNFNQISTKGAQALANNTSLTLLMLGYNRRIGDVGAQAFAKNKKLLSLDLSDNEIGNAGAQALAANTTLTHLFLSENRIRDQGAKALAANTTLRSLNVSYNPIGTEGVKALESRVFRTVLDGVNTQAENSEGVQQPPSSLDVSLLVLDGFIAAVGIAAIAIAFTLLNAASFGGVGLVVAGLGVGVALCGIGLFAFDASDSKQKAKGDLSEEFDYFAYIRT